MPMLMLAAGQCWTWSAKCWPSGQVIRNTNNANDASDANNSDGEPLLVNFIAGTIFPAVRTPMITARLEAEARRRGVTPFV